MDKLKAALEALAAYDKAKQACLDFVTEGPARGFGTCVMSEEHRRADSYGNFECSECGNRHLIDKHANTWKFCASCGSEILRWDHAPRDTEIRFSGFASEDSKPKPRMAYFTVKDSRPATSQVSYRRTTK